MKKILALLVAAVTLMSFAACDGDKDSTSGGATETTVADTTATETTEPPVTTPAETEPPLVESGEAFTPEYLAYQEKYEKAIEKCNKHTDDFIKSDRSFVFRCQFRYRK